MAHGRYVPRLARREGGRQVRRCARFLQECPAGGGAQTRPRAHSRRYVGAEVQEYDGEPFDEKMRRLVTQLREQQAEAVRLDAAIAENLKELGYGE
ncbi:SAM-dependent DNA methyltransferase [Aminiphilus circumscriptus]|uniref:SAM-dependent DNA methyltransferase n=1 Tax=Aminiphilus circumscriptus TaxID=290732 RepID=UPI001B7FCF71|nr:SAM-dependent DNA methyltransferase [Aminiphilus circumscriptus]